MNKLKIKNPQILKIIILSIAFKNNIINFELILSILLIIKN